MPRYLPPVLTRDDLPEAELCAARLDGEVFELGECFWPVDTFEGAAERGASLAAVLPRRLIAERLTAAWVHGAVSSLPRPLQLAVDTSARYRSPGERVELREVVLEAGDTEVHGGLTVTSPRRTVIDLARFSAGFGDAERMIVAALAAVGGFELADVVEHLQHRRHLPGKLRAAQRLRTA
ncbi:MAG: hypothetical protein H7146_00290 [Burkholderiaceae bacterium]|nr:hypothetical protein [Microbacteriaceae bacterium]